MKCQKCKKEKKKDEFWSERYSKTVKTCIECRNNREKTRKYPTVVCFMSGEQMVAMSCKACGKVCDADSFRTDYKTGGTTNSCAECRNRVNERLKKTGKVKGGEGRKIIKHIVEEDTVLKKCFHCEKNKKLEKYQKQSSSSDGYRAICKKCTSIRDKTPAVRENAKRYLSKPENKAKRAKQAKIWKSANREKINKTKRDRRANDPIYKLVENIRRRVQEILKQGWSKSGKSRDLTGCSPDKLRTHLESLFGPHMDWDNQGGKTGWQIDHIIPISSFDLSDPEQQKACFHYTNLQPLWAFHNLEKGDKIIDPETEQTWYE